MKPGTLALSLVLAPAAVLAQAPLPAPAKGPAAAVAPAAPKGESVATVNGVAVPRERLELLLREQGRQGAPENDPVRLALRDELINRELLAQEAARTGIGKRPEVRTELEIARQSVIVRAYLRDYLDRHPVSDAEIQQEYERARVQTGTTEYRARHILVESEEEARRLIAELKKGAKFEELAQKHSRDATRERGGDLDWNVPAAFEKPFADAMVALEKGQYTAAPVRTRFGFHVIRLEDVRPVNFPALAEIRGRIAQRLTQARLAKHVAELRAKAKIE